MPIETIDTLVVGAGQAGIALSGHLGKLGIPHLLLEKDRIAEAWRSGRWDALMTNGPVWHDRFPDLEFEGNAPDEFVSKDRVADYLSTYAKQVHAPIRTGVEVLKADRLQGRPGFRVETSQGAIEARRIVAATGAFQHPVIPPLVPGTARIEQLHSYHYRNPESLAEGGVLVVGSGSSGAQIADELNRAGRKVYLSVPRATTRTQCTLPQTSKPTLRQAMQTTSPCSTPPMPMCRGPDWTCLKIRTHAKPGLIRTIFRNRCAPLICKPKA